RYLEAQRHGRELQSEMRQLRRGHWSGQRRGRAGRRDPGGRLEQLRRSFRQVQRQVHESPCRGCPFFGEHRANRIAIGDHERAIEIGDAELDTAEQRYRQEFRALCNVLLEAGFLENDTPTELGDLASRLYGESSLLVATAIENDTFIDLEPAEFAA